MATAAVPSFFYVLVAVVHEGRCLLIREAKDNQGWYVPAGGVKLGEDLASAAVRETMEEAGVIVMPTMLQSFDHQWMSVGGTVMTKWRFILRAKPTGSLEPKRFADRHSLEANWFTMDEVKKLQLRDREVLSILHDAGGAGKTSLPLHRYLTQPLTLARAQFDD